MFLSKKDERQDIYLRKAIREIKTIIGDMTGSANDIPKLSPEAKGWRDTYGLLACILHSGDTVITLNYDLFRSRFVNAQT